MGTPPYNGKSCECCTLPPGCAYDHRVQWASFNLVFVVTGTANDNCTNCSAVDGTYTVAFVNTCISTAPVPAVMYCALPNDIIVTVPAGSPPIFFAYDSVANQTTISVEFELVSDGSRWGFSGVFSGYIDSANLAPWTNLPLALAYSPAGPNDCDLSVATVTVSVTP